MLVQFYEPFCNYIDGRIDPIDAFFVETLPNEARAIIDRYDLYRDEEHRDGLVLIGSDYVRPADFPDIFRRPVDPVLNGYTYEPKVPPHRDDGIQRVSFVVSKDAQHVVTAPAHHPYHQLWNAYSPWRQLASTVEIESFSDLQGIDASPANTVPLGIEKYPKTSQSDI